MWKLFGSKKPPSIPKTLKFQGNAAAFEYASIYMQRPLIPVLAIEEPPRPCFIYGLVKDQAAPSRYSTFPMFVVALAVDGGPQQTKCVTTITSTQVQPDDLVLLEPASYDPQLPIDHPKQHFIIIAKLFPSLDTESHLFDIDEASLPKR